MWDETVRDSTQQASLLSSQSEQGKGGVMSLFYWCDVGFLACPSPKGWQVELGLLHRLWSQWL